jgi:hypothetical protein
MARIYALPTGWLVPAAFAAYLFIALYIYAPLKTRRNQTKGVDVQYEPIELPNIAEDVSHEFFQASRWLASCGFQSRGTVSHHVANTGQDSFMSLWASPGLNDSAQIIGVRTPSADGGVKVVTLVTFRTEFTDGTAIVTSNSPSASVFPPDESISSVRCPGVHDVALLLRFHRARIERDRGGRVATLARVKDPMTRMRDEHRQTYERLIKAGYYTLDPTGQSYVPTIKGAYFMTYRLLPPFKQIQKLRKDRLAERTLRECGFGGMEAFLRSQSVIAPVQV